LRHVAIVYPAPRQVELVDIGPPPDPGPRQVLLRTVHSGITNGTERHSLLGEHGWATAFPGRNGYQQVCVVEAAGSEIRAFAPGDWVFYGQYVGHRGWNLVDVSQADGSHLVLPLPDCLDKRHAALLGVAGVAMRNVRRIRVGTGSNVWVAGLGPIGQFAAQCARAAGARVTVTDVNERRLSVARELGAHVALDPGSEVVSPEVAAGGPYTHIIDCCGAPSLLHDAARAGLVPHGGVISLLAVRSDTSFPWSMLHGTEASIEVSCHFTLDDLRALTMLIGLGTIAVGPMISHVVPVDEAPSIYKALAETPGELLGVVFDWE